MKVLIAGDTYSPPDINGAAVFTQSLALGLAKHSHRVAVLVPSATGKMGIDKQGDVDVWGLPSFRYPWHATFRIARIRGLWALVESAFDEIQPEVVHVQSHFAVGRLVARVAVRRSIPLVATSHFHPLNLVPQLPTKIPAWLSRLLVRLAWQDLGRVLQQATVVTSPSVVGAELLEHVESAESVRVISCGVDVARFRPRSDNRVKEPASLVFVGRLEKEKHVDEVVAALAYMSEKVNLNLIGVGSETEALKQLAARLHVEDRVRFLGFVSDESLPQRLSASTAFCMPGTVELQSIATLEAMACGLPIVAADASALPLLVRPGVNGFLYRPGNVIQLAAYIDNLLTSPAMCEDFRAASRSLAMQHASEFTIKAFEDLYDEARLTLSC